MKKFVGDLASYGKADTQPRKAGRGITVMLAPLAPSKRKENPNPKKHHHADDTQEPKDNGQTPPENLNNAFGDLELPEEK